MANNWKVFASEIEIFMSASTDEALAEKRQVMMLNLIVHKGKSVDERPQYDADEEKYDSCLGEVFVPYEFNRSTCLDVRPLATPAPISG